MSIHRFDPEIACLVGTNAATIYENLRHWTRKNKANNKHFYDGKTWTYNSVAAFTSLFPYLTKDQIRGAIKKLISADLIEIGNYNKQGYDQTKWYSVKSQIQLVKTPNGISENPKPIPDNKPDNKPDITHTESEGEVKKDNLATEIQISWNKMASQHDLPSFDLMTPDRLRFINARLEDCDGDSALLNKAISGVPLDQHRLGYSTGGWRADFDWVFGKATNFSKCLEAKPQIERKYRNGKSRSNNTASKVKSIGVKRRNLRGEVLAEFENEGLAKKV